MTPSSTSSSVASSRASSAGSTADLPAEETVSLVEDVSIDGMCGVY